MLIIEASVHLHDSLRSIRSSKLLRLFPKRVAVLITLVNPYIDNNSLSLPYDADKVFRKSTFKSPNMMILRHI